MGQFFHTKSSSQEDNQASILGSPHLFFGRRGREVLEFCYPGSDAIVLTSDPYNGYS